MDVTDLLTGPVLTSGSPFGASLKQLQHPISKMAPNLNFSVTSQIYLHTTHSSVLKVLISGINASPLISSVSTKYTKNYSSQTSSST